MKTVLIGDIATIHDKKRIPLNSRQRAERIGDIPYYGATGILDYVDKPIFDGEYVLIGEDGENLRSKKSDLAFKVSGKFWVNNHAHIIKGNKPWINDYIVQVFRGTDISPYVTGAAQPKLNQQALLSIPIYWPGEAEAKQIAEILGMIDNKIELNRRMNETLEKIGQALFKHYFIDNPEAKTWPKGTFGDIIINFDSKRIPLSSREREIRKGSYRYIGATSVMDHVDDYIFEGKYLLLAEDGSVIRPSGLPYLQYVWGKFWVNNHAHVLQAKKPFSVEYLYLLLSQTNVQSLVSGAVQLKINQRAMNGLKIVLPPDTQVNEFNEVIEPMFSQFRANQDGIESLTNLRDSLLPRLISGKIKV